MTAFKTAYTPAPVISNSFGVGLYILTAVDIYLDGSAWGKTTGVGAISPTGYGGFDLRNMISSPAIPEFMISTNGAPPQSLFTSVTINGNTYLSSAAVFSINSWTWNTAPISSAGSYSVQFT
jgi:hypothetical protein